MENEEQTYAYETNPDSEQLVKIKRAELRELRQKAKKDKAFRLAKKADRRIIRDNKIERINAKLKMIKERLVHYNRAGKKEKDGIDILGEISSLINNDVELIEDIEITKPASDEEIRELENEAYVPEEVEN
jgi:hypothetical protein